MISALTSSAPPRPMRPVARPPAIAEPAAPSAPAPRAPATMGPAQNAKAETAMSETRPRICLDPPFPPRGPETKRTSAPAPMPAPPIPVPYGLAVDREDRRQALAELPAILAIARRPARAAQERRHGLPRPRLGARDLEAGHHEMPDGRGLTPGATIAARARPRRRKRRTFI